MQLDQVFALLMDLLLNDLPLRACLEFKHSKHLNASLLCLKIHFLSFSLADQAMEHQTHNPTEPLPPAAADVAIETRLLLKR